MSFDWEHIDTMLGMQTEVLLTEIKEPGAWQRLGPFFTIHTLEDTVRVGPCVSAAGQMWTFFSALDRMNHISLLVCFVLRVDQS